MPQLEEGGRWVAKIWHNCISQAPFWSYFFDFSGSFFMWQLGDGVAVMPALGLLGQLNLGRIRAFQGLFIASSPSAQGGIEMTRQLVGNISRLFKEGEQGAGVLGTWTPAGLSLNHCSQTLSPPGCFWLASLQPNYRENKTKLKSASNRLIHNKYLGTKVVEFSQTGG